MLDDTPTGSDTEPTTEAAPAKKAVAKKASARAAAKKAPAKTAAAKAAPAKKPTVTTRTRKTAAKKSPAPAVASPAAEAPATDAPSAEPAPAKKTAKKLAAAKTTPAKKATTRKTAAKKTTAAESPTPADTAPAVAPGAVAAPLFQAPETAAPARKPRKKAAASSAPEAHPAADPEADPAADATADEAVAGRDAGDDQDNGEDSGDGARRRRRRGGRRRRKAGGEGDSAQDGQDSAQDSATDGAQDQDRGQDKSRATSGPDRADGPSGQGRRGPDDSDDGDGSSSPSSRRRRRRRRTGEDGGEGGDDPQNTVTRVRKTRSPEDQITSLAGSTRLEAKKQRRREGREAGRRRAPIVSEAEFLARRESVERVMAIRQRDDLTQIAVLEDKVLVEHYVARESQTSLIGNVYLGRVQNVLPSMEAAFIDIGKGRNAVLYAGEVNWSALGHKDGQPRKIESVLTSGQTILVQVTKDPVGHKGARLTSQISLAGRFLVYVPDGTNSGISRKLPDTERSRLKALLKEIVPDGAGVIVRTAAEGASEEELTSDVERLKARWEDIDTLAANKKAGAQLLYGEPDLMLKVVRDLFTEDFAKLVVQGDDAWDTVQGYVTHVAPDLEERLEKYDDSKADLFSAYRVEEQIQKGLDRKVWLPSGGSLVIDRTEAMTVVDVNTGKFTGSGGNLEETVTKNNLEAAEEMVRQLRLRDIGGIIVIDFIDMVLESNRDLVLRRLVECLGRDRTRHQVAEVTSLGLVQMTRKRIGTGLVEAFSEPCERCNGRGVVIADEPVEPKRDQDAKRGARRSRGGRGRGEDSSQPDSTNGHSRPPTPKDVAAMARTPKPEDSDEVAETPTDEPVDATQELDPATDTPTPETAAVDVPEQPAEPVAPQVVTRTRSRRASRPPELAPQPPAAEATAPEPSEPTPTPVPEPAPEPIAPIAPKVVTRTRGRSASRPAGPPATSAPQTEPAPTLPGVVEHVPVKKRGARKR